MKKISLFLIASILSLSLMACGADAPAVQEESPAGPDPSQETPLEEEPAQEEENLASGKVFIADAALYRGTVTAVETTEEGTLLTLEQAPGTDFGSPSRQFLLTEESRLSFKSEQIVPNVYLEVYYTGKNPEEAALILGANFYEAAEMVNFNGTLSSVWESPDRPGQGSLAMVERDTGEEVHFNYDKNGGTQFYLDFDALQPGDELNIFHQGIYTLSLPPQGIALEVRPYAAPEEADSQAPAAEASSPETAQ